MANGPQWGNSTSAAPQDPSIFGINANEANLPVTLHGAEYPTMPASLRSRLSREDRPYGKPAVSTTVSQALANYGQLDAEQLTGMQQLLYAGNFYSSSYYARNGKVPDWGNIADGDTYAAYTNAVETAVRLGKPIDELLRTAAATSSRGTGEGKSGSKRLPLVIKTSSPDEINVGLQDVAQKILRRNLTSDEINHYVQDYQHLQSSSQQQAYDMQGTHNEDGTFTAGKGGTVTQPPPLQDYAIQRFQTDHPVAYGVTKLAQAAEDFFALMNQHLKGGL
jgi:hypothetical protein